MLNDKYLRKLVINALNHHLVPSNTSYKQEPIEYIELNTNLRSTIKSILLIGGREITPTPNLHDKCYLLNNYFNTQSNETITPLTNLPTNLSHMQCVLTTDNYLYIIGGCVSQCAHGESAVSSTYRYDPRFNQWSMVKPMLEKRSYFYACAVTQQSILKTSAEKRKLTLDNEFIYSIGGRNKDGSLNTVEKYNLKTNTWHTGPMLPSALYAHSGCVFNNTIYISGGYNSSMPHNQFTSDLYALMPTTNEWTHLRPMNAARGWHCMTVVQNKLYVFGGCILLTPNIISSNQPQTQIAHPVQTTEYYSVETNQWTIVKPMINMHKEAQCIHLNNYIYILGGYNIQNKTGQKLISKYDYLNDLWQTFVYHLPSGMTGMGCCLIELPNYLFDSKNSSSELIAQLVNCVDSDLSDEEDMCSHYDGDQEEDDLDKNVNKIRRDSFLISVND